MPIGYDDLDASVDAPGRKIDRINGIYRIDLDRIYKIYRIRFGNNPVHPVNPVKVPPKIILLILLILSQCLSAMIEELKTQTTQLQERLRILRRLL